MGIRESKIKNRQGLPLNGYVRAVQVSDGVLASGRDVDFIFTASKKKNLGSGRTNTRSEKKEVKKSRILEIVSKNDET